MRTANAASRAMDGVAAQRFRGTVCAATEANAWRVEIRFHVGAKLSQRRRRDDEGRHEGAGGAVSLQRLPVASEISFYGHFRLLRTPSADTLN